MKGIDANTLIIYMDFKNRPKELMVVEIRIVVVSGVGWVIEKEHKRTF